MTYRTIAATLAIAILSSAAPAAGQAGPPPARGMVADDGGEWRSPTVEEALHALTLEHRGEWRPLRRQSFHSPMTAILRQALGRDPAIDIDALADALADMILADRSPDGRVGRNAAAALTAASSPAHPDYGGTPHARSLDALIRVYETRAAQVLAASGGEDLFLEALGSQGELLLSQSLSDVFRADPEGRGRDYVLGIQQRSNPPPEYCGQDRMQLSRKDRAVCRQDRDSTWCVAGGIVHNIMVHDAREERRQEAGNPLVGNGFSPAAPARTRRSCREVVPALLWGQLTPRAGYILGLWRSWTRWRVLGTVTI